MFSLRYFTFLPHPISLYPAAMKKQFPTESYTTVQADDELQALSKICFSTGFYDISFIPNKKLMIAILPRKNKRGGLEWTLDDGRGVYCDVDINNAIRFGYTITAIHHAKMYAFTAPIFAKYVTDCYELKKAAKKSGNRALYVAAKNLMNSMLSASSHAQLD